jgi:outer membrane lipoprotein-sorting protein
LILSQWQMPSVEIRLTTFRVVFRSALVVLFSSAIIADPASYEENAINGVDRAALSREMNLDGYSVTENYTVRNSRFQAGATMTVKAVYRRVSGKSYSVVDRNGSSVLQARVLDKLLTEEAEMSRGVTRQQALVTSANYKMRLIGREALQGHNCDVLELVPRMSSPHLLKGRAWVDAKDYYLVRIEGKPTASPSFLAGRPMITRDYKQIEGFSFATRSHALADGFLLGKTELTIEYSNYKLAVTAKRAVAKSALPSKDVPPAAPPSP